MLVAFDVGTIWALSSVSMLLGLMIMSSIYFLNKNVNGTFIWLLAILSLAATTSLFAIRAKPAFRESNLLAFLSNEIAIIGFMLILLGTQRFLGGGRYQQFLFASLLGLFSLLAFQFMYLDWVISRAMVLMSSATVVIFSLVIISLVLGHRKLPPGERYPVGSTLLALSLLAYMAKDFFRLAYIDNLSLDSIFHSHVFNVLVAGSALFLPLLLVLSFAILCNEKKEVDLKRLHQEAKEHAALRSSLLATMSHEIRTPLNGIMGTAQLMLANHSDQSVQNDCLTIINSVELLNDLSNNVLEYSKLDFHDLPCEEDDCRLGLCLENIMLLMRPLAHNKSLDLSLEMDEKLYSCYLLDHQKIRQVLINLIGNAIKFTEKGQVKIQVSLQSRTAQSDCLKFSVLDTGIGIPASEQAHLLRPFIQASNVANRYSGSGLGLSISQKLLVLLGGELEFSSTLNLGSCFYFQLSLAKGDAELAQLSQVEQQPQGITGLSILLVEDLPLNQDIAIAMLARDQHKVTLAADMAQALKRVKEQKYDLILSDINLPDGDGISLSRQIIAQNGPNAATPIAAMTARVSHQDREEYLNSGMAFIVTKPVKLSQLRSVIYQSQGALPEAPDLSVDTDRVLSSECTLFNCGRLMDIAAVLPQADFLHLLNQLPQQLEDNWQHLLTLSAGVADSKSQAHPLLIKALHNFTATSAQLGFEQLAQASGNMENQLRRQSDVVDIRSLDELKRLSLDAFTKWDVGGELVNGKIEVQHESG